MVEGERRSAEDIDFDTLADSARDAVAYVESAATIQINYTDPGYDDKDLLSRNKKSPNYEANAEREGLFVQSLNEILDDFLTLSGTVSEMARVNFITFAREEFQGRKGGQLLRNLYKAVRRGKSAAIRQSINAMYVHLTTEFSRKFNKNYAAHAEAAANQRKRTRRDVQATVIGEHNQGVLERRRGASAEAKERWELRHGKDDDLDTAL